jgi:hypothetical protein
MTKAHFIEESHSASNMLIVRANLSNEGEVIMLCNGGSWDHHLLGSII